MGEDMPNFAKALRLAVASLLVAGTACAQEMLSPGGLPPNYYPGIANGVPAFMHEQWRQWAHARKPAILALWARIKAAQASGQVPGCIGQTVEDCIVTLAQDLALADDYTRPSLLDPAQIDVNGKLIIPKFIGVFAFRPGAPGQSQPKTISYLQERHLLFLRFSDANKINEIDMADGSNTLLRARTETDYEHTFVYEILRPLTRAQCPQLAKLELDRFIENRLKPPVRNAAVIGASTNSRINVMSSSLLPFCGRKLRLEVTTERPRYHPHDLLINTRLIIR